MSRSTGIISGVNGSQFGVELRDVRKRTRLTKSAEMYGEDGKQESIKALRKKTTLVCRGFVNGDENMPEAGDTLSYQGQTYLVTESDQMSAEGAYQQYGITAEREDNATVEGI